ncbi:MAG: hypothetical protein ACOC5T_04220 [Elusimicrobiota bacterium]
MTRFKEITGEAEIKNVKFESDAETGSLKDSDGTNIKCDAYIEVDVDGTTYYLPLYDTKN